MQLVPDRFIVEASFCFTGNSLPVAVCTPLKTHFCTYHLDSSSLADLLMPNYIFVPEVNVQCTSLADTRVLFEGETACIVNCECNSVQRSIRMQQASLECSPLSLHPSLAAKQLRPLMVVCDARKARPGEGCSST